MHLKDAHIVWRTKVLDEKIERFYRDDTAPNAQAIRHILDEHQERMSEIRDMDEAQWTDFVRSGYDDPIAARDQSKAKQLVSQYTTSQRSSDADAFEQRRSNAEFEYNVMNMSAGELRDAFQTQAALSKPKDDVSKMMLESSKAICAGIARPNVFNSPGEERVLQLFWQRAQMIKDPDLIEDLVQHVADKNELDDFSVQRLRVAVRAPAMNLVAPHLKSNSNDAAPE